jgi:DNA repair exonuclease SbcCD nuclease subunit
MQICHTGDWHVGSSRFLPNYLERQISGIRSVYEKAKELKLRTILVSGDLVEKDLRPHERDALLQLLLEKDDEGFESLIISGNHDMLARGYSNLRFLEHLDSMNRFKSTYVAVETPRIVRLHQQDFLLFPGFCPEKNINRELKKWIRRCQDPPIVLMHEVVKGATADNGFKLEHGVRIDPDLKVLYFACGDLHKFQKLTGISNGFYCGSPIQHDFGEVLPKGFLQVDTENPTNPRFIEIESISNLETVSEAKEVSSVEKNAWVRIKSESLVDSEDLPDRVLKVDYVPAKKDRIEDEDGSTQVDLADEVVSMEELKKFLKKRARLRGKPLRVALRKAESYIAKVGGSS